jgi:hypothetical protein
VTHPPCRLLPIAAALLLCCAQLGQCPAYGAGGQLYGVHWWDFNGSQVGQGAAGGWSTETVITHSEPWWQAGFFQPLYQTIAANHNASIITRIDYNWGETIPSPANPHRAGWAANVQGVVATLGDYSHTWIIGNEPNIVGEGNGWANNRVTPSGYAAVYREIRSAIKAIRPQDEVLVAAPSPGGVIPGVRWMAGNQWLWETIDAIDSIEKGAIDGFSLHAYGNPFASAAVAVQQFRNEYASQLAVIDARGYHEAPVYITEWNRATSVTGNLAANEQTTADFIRGAFADVHAWNQTPGNHNIVSMSWFVQNKHYGGWQEYSLDHWKSIGNPVGHPGDLWTAFLEGAQYPAGLKGTRPLPSGPAIGDFDGDGAVSGSDLLVWQRGFGKPNPSPQEGDANGDGAVDGADLVIWKGYFGTHVASDAVATPEPATASLISVSIVFFMTRCRKRRSGPPVSSLLS